MGRSNIDKNCWFCRELDFEELGIEHLCKINSTQFSQNLQVKLKIDDFIDFVIDAHTAHLILTTRHKWQVINQFFSLFFLHMKELACLFQLFYYHASSYRNLILNSLIFNHCNQFIVLLIYVYQILKFN